MKKRNQVYFKLGLTLLCVVLASTVFMVILFNLRGFFNVIKGFFRIISPLLFGILFAYLMNPIMRFVENGLMYLIRRWGKKAKVEDAAWMRSRKRACHVTGVVASLLALLALIYLAISLVVPTIAENIATIFTQNTVDKFNYRLHLWVQQLFSDSPKVRDWALGKLNEMFHQASAWLTNLDLKDTLVSLLSRVYGVVKGTLNVVLGFVIAVYMLLSKEKFLGQMKKLVVALFSERHANRLLEFGRRTNKIFSGFVLGKIIDSIIIGIICFIIMSILNLPYPMLISVIVGVTNIIPFFGPLIGAIPSALLILLINPLQCLIFVIMVVLLQQFDGNILGPRILGDSVGLSSFWILISITLFSGLFGVPGMIIGVPVFAVLYMLLSDYVRARLEKKGRPLKTEIYENIKSTDDIELMRRRLEYQAEHDSLDADADAYDPEPEIEELEPPEEDLPEASQDADQIESILRLLDNSQ